MNTCTERKRERECDKYEHIHSVHVATLEHT